MHFVPLITLCLTLYSLAGSCCGTLTKVLPMIWTDTTTTLTSGESSAILMIKFIKPCEQFYDTKIVPETLDYFSNWCNKEFDESVVYPLEEMCRPEIASGRGRKKRWVSETLAAVPLVVGAVQSVVGLFSSPEPPSRDPAIEELIAAIGKISHDIQNIQNRVTAGEQRQEELEGKVKLLKEALSEIDDRLQKVEVDVEQIKEWKKSLMESLGPTVTLVSKLSSFFAISKSNLNEVMREWKERRLSLRLFDVFMMGTNQSLLDTYRGSTPLECHIDARHGVAYFAFRKSNTDSRVHVLRAAAFSLYEMKPNSTLGYRVTYVGPSEVAYDAIADCMVPYSGGTADVLLFSQASDCLVMQDKSVYKYWQKTCELMYYLDESVIQVKAIGELYFIYCYGFEIHIYKATHPCPNYVFSINSKEKIEVLNGKTIVKYLRPSTFEISQDFHSTKAVRHLMPKIGDLDFEKLELSGPCPLVSKKTGEVVEQISVASESFGKSIVIGGFVGIILLVIVVAVVGYICIQKRIQGRPHRVNRNMSGIYSSVQPDENCYVCVK